MEKLQKKLSKKFSKMITDQKDDKIVYNYIDYIYNKSK